MQQWVGCQVTTNPQFPGQSRAGGEETAATALANFAFFFAVAPGKMCGGEGSCTRRREGGQEEEEEDLSSAPVSDSEL